MPSIIWERALSGGCKAYLMIPGWELCGAMKCGDGIAIGWLGHPTFRTRAGAVLYTRRMPSFFESFPVILVDERGTVRAWTTKRLETSPPLMDIVCALLPPGMPWPWRSWFAWFKHQSIGWRAGTSEHWLVDGIQWRTRGWSGLLVARYPSRKVPRSSRRLTPSHSSG